MAIVNNYTQVEVYDLAAGKIVNTIQLNKDMKRLLFTDAFIITSTPQNITYSVMSNKELRIFENHKEKWALNAK